MPTDADPMIITDRAGHRWRPTFDDAALAEARRAGLDVAGAAARGLAHVVEHLLRGPREIGTLLGAACERQMHEAGLSPEAFARLMTADVATFEAAAMALVLAIVERHPTSRLATETGPALVFMAALDRLTREGMPWQE